MNPNTKAQFDRIFATLSTPLESDVVGGYYLDKFSIKEIIEAAKSLYFELTGEHYEP